MSVTFHGTLFDGETLAAMPVMLSLADGRISSPDDAALPPVSASEVRVSDRLGHMPRYLYFPGNRTVETGDNAAVDALLAGQRRGRLVALIHALETHARVAAVATLLLVATIAATMWWGLPVLAYRTALAVPTRIDQQAGRTALAALNRILAPSNLSNADRQRVQSQVARLTKAAGLKVPPEIFFRSMGGQSPNAFALPGGLIVVSDELVQLATDGELAAVLAHEIGHWQYRHGLQSVLRGSTSLLLVSTVTGDLSALTTFAGTIPFLLLQRGYSREFEAQADVYAVDLMRKAGIDAQHFASILGKLEGIRPSQGTDYTYLSTHPGTNDRIKALGLMPVPAEKNGLAFSQDSQPGPGKDDLIAPQAVSKTLPQYPPEMAATHIPGRVLVEFSVDADGSVRDTRILKSNRREFEAPALAAIRQWRFTPGRRHGANAAIKLVQLVEFNPDDPSAVPATAEKP